MSAMLTVILAIQLLCALVMIGLILIQHGKGADMGAAFGGGSAGSVFGASGSANFLSRTTGVLAAVFFVATLALAYFSNVTPRATGSVLDGAVVPGPAQQIPGAAPQQVPPPASGGAASPSVPAPVAGEASVPPPATPTTPAPSSVPAPASGTNPAN